MRVVLYAPGFRGQSPSWSGGSVVFDAHGRAEVDVADTSVFSEFQSHSWMVLLVEGVPFTPAQQVAVAAEPPQETLSENKDTKPLSPVKPLKK